MMRKILSICTVLLLAACGTVATPVYDAPTTTPTVAAETTAQQHEHDHPTATPIPPTVTPLPVTEVSTAVPTEVPTEAPTQAAAADPMKLFVDLALASNGDKIFHEQNFITEQGEWMCTTCHNTEGEEIKIGPSLFGIIDRAATRIEGQGPYTYLYNSIRNAHDFIVPGFEDAAHMPHFTKETLSDAQIYDLMAYLVTLK